MLVNFEQKYSTYLCMIFTNIVFKVGIYRNILVACITTKHLFIKIFSLYFIKQLNIF